MNQFQLVCILSIIAIAHAGGDPKEEDKKFTKFVEECKKETNASDEDVKLFDEDQFPETKTQYCFLACYYKKSGVMNDDNSINIDKAIEEFEDVEEDKETQGKFVKIMKDCHTKYTPTKECDSVKTYFECLVKSAKEAGIPLEK